MYWRIRLPSHALRECTDTAEGTKRGDGIGVAVGPAAGAAWLAMLVAVGDLPGVPADGTRFGGTTSAAVTR